MLLVWINFTVKEVICIFFVHTAYISALTNLLDFPYQIVFSLLFKDCIYTAEFDASENVCTVSCERLCVIIVLKKIISCTYWSYI